MKISLLIKMKMPTIISIFIFISRENMKNSLLINMKMPTIVGIFIFISRENFMLSWVEHEKSLITLGPGVRGHMFSLWKIFLVSLSLRKLCSLNCLFLRKNKQKDIRCIVSYFSMKTYIMGTLEVFLMSTYNTYNVCFCGEVRKCISSSQ